MKKNYFLKSIMIMLLSLLLSCDNTTADPINQNNVNPATGSNGSTGSTGSNGSNGSTITGPRILHKIMAGSDVNEEYVTTAGILQKSITLDASGPNSFLIGDVTYTSGKVSKVKFRQEVNGSVPSNGLTYDYTITYDSSGKVNGTVCLGGIGTAILYTKEFAYTYDSSGKMTNILEKQKSGTTYNAFANYTFINVGDNITKVSVVQGSTSPSGVPDMSNTQNLSYDYAYDNKINPYTTLPRTYFLTMALLHHYNFNMLSGNNVSSFSVNYPAPAPTIPGGFTYLYDSQNYPTSDQTQTKKYIYKAL
jgi:hypothetical protein